MFHGPCTVRRSLWGLLEAPRTKNDPWAQFRWGPRGSMGPKSDPWPGTIERVQDHQDPGLPKAAGEDLGDEFSPKGFSAMSSKPTELTESSPSAPPPYVLCGSGVLSQLASTSMGSSGNLHPSQTYGGYKAVEKPCHQTGRQASNVRRYLWSKKYGPFGKELPVSEAPTPDANSGYSALTGSRQRDVARWTNVGGPLPVGVKPIYSNAEGSYELDGEEVEVVPNSSGHPVNFSPSHPPAKRIQSHIIHNTPRNFQTTLDTIPPASPNPSLKQGVRPSPISQPRNSPMVTSQQPQPVASTSRRREELSPFPFPAVQVFQCQD
ncbi:hypothetical protein O181_090874 [Austropuccinia psidii MF-1]|uniref:Uncharacterized protein n=1 Tax=Austropuccinia psidii MF-1 TaxID=1389203 RepID=A0A9Q3IW95_9BASI|nr:hypothetical protein [Austropuccinia psidii MF-1]